MNQISNISIFCFLLLSQCYGQDRRTDYYSFPSHYSLENVKKFNLSNDLEEISGLEWINEQTLWAIEDESSIIFELNPNTGKITDKQKFAKNKDIEDLMILENDAWVLQSNGNLYQVEEPLTEYSNTTIHKFPIQEKRDFEALIKSPDQSLIWIFCKVCSWDKNSNKSSVFAFNLESMSFEEEANFILENEQLEPLLKEDDFKKVKMQPSAIAFHPIEKNYYLLSSSDHWVMVLDQEFNPISFHHLNPALFKQPEGITFSKDGTLFISNEARDGRPNILIFPYQP